MNRALLRQRDDALNPGGLVLILEQLAEGIPGSAAKAVTRLLALAFFHQLGGQIYAFEELVGWLREAGFVNPRRSNVLTAAGMALVQATKVA